MTIEERLTLLESRLGGDRTPAYSPIQGLTEFDVLRTLNIPPGSRVGTDSGQILVATDGLGFDATVASNAGLALTGAFQLIPGMTVNIPVGGNWLALVSVCALLDAVDGAVLVQVLVNGVVQGANLVMDNNTGVPGNIIMHGARQWVFAANTNDPIRVEAKKAGGAGFSAINVANVNDSILTLVRL